MGDQQQSDRNKEHDRRNQQQRSNSNQRKPSHLPNLARSATSVVAGDHEGTKIFFSLRRQLSSCSFVFLCLRGLRLPGC